MLKVFFTTKRAKSWWKHTQFSLVSCHLYNSSIFYAVRYKKRQNSHNLKIYNFKIEHIFLEGDRTTYHFFGQINLVWTFLQLSTQIDNPTFLREKWHIPCTGTRQQQLPTASCMMYVTLIYLTWTQQHLFFHFQRSKNSYQ